MNLRRSAGIVLATLAMASTIQTATGTTRSIQWASSYSPADSPGRMACNGKRLTWHTMAVASRTLRCGTRLRISYGKHSVIARVEDRGPWIYSRSLDLAPGVYHALIGSYNALVWGVRPVRVLVLKG